MDWLNRLRNWFRPKTVQRRVRLTTRQAAEVQAWMNGVLATREDELSCDEVYALVDQFVEAVARGEKPEQVMPLVHRHLNKCPECKEEYEALLALVQGPAS